MTNFTTAPDGMSLWTPLLKFVDHKTGNEITVNDSGELPEPYNTDMIKMFYKCIEQVNESYKREGDLEVTEIYLYNEGKKPYWTYKRIRRFDNNRFGYMRKALEDYSGIECKVRPLKKNHTLHIGIIHTVR